MPGYDYERAVDSGGAIAGGAVDSGAVCAQVSMYMKQPNLLVGCASCFFKRWTNLCTNLFLSDVYCMVDLI